uniref:Uncharacterized protein n=1 Tax=Alexandrium monilatum TaxID=311494 RepID=A0A7S4S1P9_9DINO
MEYFDFCPRLRVLREFFGKASPFLLAHRYCDLRLDEFLLTYCTCGREMGLEMSFFEPGPHCWMYFYANAGVSGLDLEASIDWWDERINFIGANDGHVSTRVEIEPSDSQHALAFWPEFRAYEEVGMTERKLAKYLAAFRNVMEISLARSFSRKVDQRLFDGFVCYGIKNSFGRFLYRIDSSRRDATRQRVARCCQRYAAGLARNFKVRILWHDRERVFLPEEDATNPFA